MTRQLRNYIGILRAFPKRLARLKMFRPAPFSAMVLSKSSVYMIIGTLLPSAFLSFTLACTHPRRENLIERVNRTFSWITFIFFRWVPPGRHQNFMAVLMIAFIAYLVQVSWHLS